MIVLKPETEAIFVNAAQVRGLSLPDLLDEVAEQLARDIAREEEEDRLQDADDLEMLRHRLENPDLRPNRTLDELRQHIAAQRALENAQNQNGNSENA